MANLPLNENYSSSPVRRQGPLSSSDFKSILEAISKNKQSTSGNNSLAGYRPSTRLRDYTSFADQMPFSYSGEIGSPEREASEKIAMRRYGSLINEGEGLATGQPFYPSDAGSNQTSDMPESYGDFADPMSIDKGDYKLSWGTPANPKIRNINVGGNTGQYVEDVENRDLLVKTKRQRTDVTNKAMRQGRPGHMYQVDHIMPLALGGADTDSNKQLLTYSQNDKKTKAQAVPYTLYAYGDISLQEARIMSMQWKDKDLSDIPQPNDVGFVSDVGDKSGIEIAREAREVWGKPKKVGFKEVMAGIPDAMKNLGEDKLPDPVREFIKGFGSQGTLGFLPYEMDDDASKGSWLGGKLGQIGGGVASFMIGAGLISGAVKGVTGTYRTFAGAKAAQAGFGLKALKASHGAVKAADAAKKTSAATSAIKTTWKMNASKQPAYIARVLGDSERLKRMGHFAVLSGAVGQGERFVHNKFNPYILSGQAMETDQGGTGAVLGNIFKDMAMGSLFGAASPTLKGVGYAVALPTIMGLMMDPDNPTEAIVDGVAFGALHAMGVRGKPGFNNVEMLGGKKYVDPVTRQWQDNITKASYESVKFHEPSLTKFKYNEQIPEKVLFEAEQTGIYNIANTFFSGKDISLPAKKKIVGELQKYANKSGDVLNNSVVEDLPFTMKFSRVNRKTRTTEIESRRDAVVETFGRDAKIPKLKEAEPFAGKGDLSAMFNEIKRLKMSVHELSKNGLDAKTRSKVDMNDLLTISRNELQGRFKDSEKLINPPVAKRTTDLFDKTFLERSFLNDKTKTQPDGTYQTGTMAIVGAESGKSAGFDYFMEQKALGNASPNILFVRAPYLDWLWRMKNKMLTPEEIKDGRLDPHPENTILAYGVVAKKNAKGETIEKEMVNIGYAASEHRTQTGKNSYNNNEAVKKWEKTEGKEGLPPITKNKDDIVRGFEEHNLEILIGNFHPSSTVSTNAKKRFSMVTFEERNWTASKELSKKLIDQEVKGIPQENTSSLFADIKEYEYAKTPQKKEAMIKRMNEKITDADSASNRIPTSGISPEVKGAKDALVGRETTRELLMIAEDSLGAKTAGELKTRFLNQFGMVLEEGMAKDLFARRNELSTREMIRVLNEAKASGNMNDVTKIRLELTESYIGSRDYRSGKFKEATTDLVLAPKKIELPENNVEPLPEKYKTNFVTDLKAAKPTPDPKLLTESPLLKHNRTISGDEATTYNYETIGKERMDLLMDKKYPNLSETKTKHENITEELLRDAQVNLQKLKVPQKVINTVRTKLKERLESYSKLITEERAETSGPTKKIYSEIENIQKNILETKNPKTKAKLKAELAEMRESAVDMEKTESLHEKALIQDNKRLFEKESKVEMPNVKSDSFFSSIKEGLKSKDPAKFGFAKAFDVVLQHIQNRIGKKNGDYTKNKDIAELLSSVSSVRSAADIKKMQKKISETKDPKTKTELKAELDDGPVGNRIWSEYFPDTMDVTGEGISQPRSVMNSRASGKFELERKRMQKREKESNKRSLERKEEPTTKTAESKNRGLVEQNEPISASEWKSMSVKDMAARQDQILDLTHLENIMAGVSATDVPMSAKTAILDVKHLFYGSGGSVGLLKLRNMARPNKKKMAIDDAVFDKLLKDAEKYDNKFEYLLKPMREKIERSKKAIPTLKERLEALKEVDPDNPPAEWELNVKESKIEDIMKNIRNREQLIKEGEGGPGTGMGGPGYDGRGGFWNNLGSGIMRTGNKINNAASNMATKATNAVADWSYKKYKNSDIANSKETGPVGRFIGGIADTVYGAKNDAVGKLSGLASTVKTASSLGPASSDQSYSRVPPNAAARANGGVIGSWDKPQEKAWSDENNVKPQIQAWDKPNGEGTIKWKGLDSMEMEVIPEKAPQQEKIKQIIAGDLAWEPTGDKEFDWFHTGEHANDMAKNNLGTPEAAKYEDMIRSVFGKDADMAVAIMRAESKAAPDVIGDKHLLFNKTSAGEDIPWTGDSVGLFQIRTGGDEGGGYWSRPMKYGISIDQYRKNMKDPWQNILEAKRIFDDSHESWWKWSTYQNEKYKDYL